jgi:nucleoside-diphosphate-sugar epimerase
VQMPELPATTALEELVRLSRDVEFGKSGATDPRIATLTRELLRERRKAGPLVHPYGRIRAHCTPLSPRVAEYLRDRRVLVTGAGTIGTRIVRTISPLSPRAVCLVDIEADRLAAADLEGVPTYTVDVADRRGLEAAFADFEPDVVFHTAAERDPARAERVVRAAVRAHVLGTLPVCAVARASRVDRVVHASTGKCRLLYDERVYPASKQLAEVAVALSSRAGEKTRFSCVRFHHVVENSLVEDRFRRQLASGGPLTVHLPVDRRQHGQNADEAVAMLLNAGLRGERAEIFASTRQMDYFAVLDLALYLIDEARADVGVLFTSARPNEGYLPGDPPGTRRPATADPERLTHGFHTLETDLESLGVDRALLLASAPFPPFDATVARSALDTFLAETSTLATDDELRRALYRALFAVAESIYQHAPARRLVDCARFATAEGAESPLTDGARPSLELLRRALQRTALDDEARPLLDVLRRRLS